jgi:hypothetical protein
MDAFLKKLVITCSVIILALTSTHAVELEKSYKNLVLNGQGTRDKFFIDLYVGGLYLKEKSSDFQTIIDADEKMSIRLHIVSSLITSKKMEDGTREGFTKSTNGNTEQIKEKIETFLAVFLEEIKENDIYDFLYIPSTGVQIYKNSELKETIISLEFKKALYGIWIGENPAQNSLKEDMLGE